MGSGLRSCIYESPPVGLSSLSWGGRPGAARSSMSCAPTGTLVMSGCPSMTRTGAAPWLWRHCGRHRAGSSLGGAPGNRPL